MKTKTLSQIARREPFEYVEMIPRIPLTKRGQPRLRAPGAGRPQRDPESGTMERRTSWLYPAQWAEAERLGDGVASVGLRRIIDALGKARKRKAIP